MKSTRLEFIRTASLGAAVAAVPSLLRAAVPATTAAATPPTPNAVSSIPVLIDWHTHFITKAEVRILRARTTAPRVFDDTDGTTKLENASTVSSLARQPSGFEVSDIAARISHLDKVGIQRQLLSHTVALGLDATLPVSELRVLFRAFNDELAEVVRAHPTRFFGVAALPSADPVWAAEELHRAHKDLGLIGGSLPLNAFATLEGARTLAPIFAAGQKNKSHFFIHRGPANSVVPGQPPLILPTDTDYARWSVINNHHLTHGAITLGLTDFLDPYPDVSVQVIMLGGFFPYILDSLIASSQKAGVPDPLGRIRRIYLDPGPYARNGKWVALAADTIGADRVLFGTDYGVGGGNKGDSAPGLAALAEALTTEQKRLIYSENSRLLLKSKGLI
ncbi:MAG: amidohydrolase family protein [Verrucomicrobiota bacterium]|nr:amidohydrolase family protein [Verrucomicrobiota bacterium]